MKKSRRRSSADERGFALISAIVLAFLIFSLIALILIESTLSLRMAQNYRARITAVNLAESALQLALQELEIDEDGVVDFNGKDGKMTTTCRRSPDLKRGGYKFVIEATGQSAGLTRSIAKLTARGHQGINFVVVEEVIHVEQ
jgi:Tfp pilus assembly protein PilX